MAMHMMRIYQRIQNWYLRVNVFKIRRTFVSSLRMTYRIVYCHFQNIKYDISIFRTYRSPT